MRGGCNSSSRGTFERGCGKCSSRRGQTEAAAKAALGWAKTEARSKRAKKNVDGDGAAAADQALQVTAAAAAAETAAAAAAAANTRGAPTTSGQ
jgi:hypothetical protein